MHTEEIFITNSVNEYSDMVLRIAFQHTRNRHDAEDILQEVFISLMQQENPPEDMHLKAWLIRVTINKCKDLLKSARRKKTVSLDEALHYGVTMQEAAAIDEIQALPPPDRDVLYLHYFEGYSAKEIGEIFGKSESAVFTRLKRARRRLKMLIDENSEKEV
ncbi:MAG: RNA polymerase sigma factor [Firmicutes bacterium]|nr:RNA polymerase sigma factor [Bacillota bacterium]